jgi:hypothetical protein
LIPARSQFTPCFGSIATEIQHGKRFAGGVAAAGSDAAASGLATQITKPGGYSSSSSNSTAQHGQQQQQRGAGTPGLLNPLQLLFGKSWRKAVLLSVLFFTSTFIFTMLQVGRGLCAALLALY